MARRDQAFAGNAPGGLFVDESCIDCGTCYTHAPETFRDAGTHSIVAHQPGNERERARAHEALVACPTASIGSDDPRASKEASERFPIPFTDEIDWCGYTAGESFGAWSWLIRRPAGNVLVDSPRAAAPLLRRIEAVGGVSLMVLSHRDDVADHEAIHRHFGCPRLMHADDGVPGMERLIPGPDPVAIAPDLVFIPTPGHTRGSSCLLYRDTFLFSGDHLWYEPSLGRLHASRSVNWWRWDEQLRSLAKLLHFDFQWVLPGHGAPWGASSPAAMRAMLERTIAAL